MTKITAVQSAKTVKQIQPEGANRTEESRQWRTETASAMAATVRRDRSSTTRTSRTTRADTQTTTSGKVCSIKRSRPLGNKNETATTTTMATATQPEKPGRQTQADEMMKMIAVRTWQTAVRSTAVNGFRRSASTSGTSGTTRTPVQAAARGTLGVTGKSKPRSSKNEMYYHNKNGPSERQGGCWSGAVTVRPTTGAQHGLQECSPAAARLPGGGGPGHHSKAASGCVEMKAISSN